MAVRRTIKPTSHRTGKIVDIVADRGRKALLPGKRISSKGNIYWETRKNRSDLRGSKI